MDVMQAEVQIQWGVKIPLRDGIQLNATLYLPEEHSAPSPAILTLTPYIAQTYHDQGVYFARHGYPFLTVDVRGRGNSEGEFQPFIAEARDGFDVVEWLAEQPYCNGKVGMWGGSYGGLNQWAAAREFPPHLATIAPVASVHIGTDFPMRSNIFWPYLMQWLTLTSGRTSQEKIFEDHVLWSRLFEQWFKSGIPFKKLDTFLGNASAIFQEWISHPRQDGYWDRYNPTSEQYAKLSVPILTITGIYDNAQRGALMHYRKHIKDSADNRARHYLVIGPWDHAGTRKPIAEFGGLKFGSESLVDLPKLHREWYAWTMQGASKPEFLKKNIAYYVTGAERWCFANTLEEITADTKPLYLNSRQNASHLFGSGSLAEQQGDGEADVYVYDPRDTSIAKIERRSSDPHCLRPAFPTNNLTDQRHIYLSDGRQLIYHSAPFRGDIEIAGFFALTAWLSIDQPDTDIGVTVYAIDRNGGSILLTSDAIRARYRESLREQRLIHTKEPLRYEFLNFTFVSRQLNAGDRLRLVIGPVNSIYTEKNYNSGGTVSEESMNDARPVTVRLFHDKTYPSLLYVPLSRVATEECSTPLAATTVTPCVSRFTP